MSLAQSAIERKSPEIALAAYALTPEEKATLRQLSAQQFAQFASDLSLLDGELTDEMLEQVSGSSITATVYKSITVGVSANT